MFFGNKRQTDNVGTEYDTDDFRPTTPGHSPGAGHSTGPNSDDRN
ncbi:hypothetical protein ERO13_A06G016500v2 [Gossypium hirsutum]|nr:hypothetical protein ERO13_A06G016500v2 [Gossypium hirsutum]